MKAVIETGGKQYYVEEGSVIYVEKLDAQVGQKINFDKVLMVNGNPGRPYLSNVEVVGEVLKQGKDKKIKIFKYNAKKKYRKTQGHRQPYKENSWKIMVKISLKGTPIKEITIKGHAGYDESGKDIVCAALSSIVITSINAIIRIDNEAIDYEDKNGIKVEVLKHDNIIDSLIDNLIELLIELKEKYPKYIEIRRC